MEAEVGWTQYEFGFSANCSHAVESFWLLGICLLLLNFLRPQQDATKLTLTTTIAALFGSLHMHESFFCNSFVAQNYLSVCSSKELEMTT